MKVGKSSTSSTSSAGYSGRVASRAYGQAQGVQAPRPVQDSFEVSESGAVIKQAMEAVSNTPDIRAEPVARVKQEIDEGSYFRDERAIADKMINDHLTPSNPF